jgi:hypothetical protein
MMATLVLPDAGLRPKMRGRQCVDAPEHSLRRPGMMRRGNNRNQDRILFSAALDRGQTTADKN